MPVFFLVLIYNYLQISLIKRNFLYSIYIINRQSCDIKRDGGSVGRFNLDMPDEKSAQELADKFGGGTYIPEARLALFDAMEAVSNYKKAMIDNIMKFSD